MTLAEIAEVVGGRVDGPDDVAVKREAFVDSRSVVPAGLYVAVRGEHVDGHDFAADAVADGAAAALVTRPVGVPAVVVGDPVAALGRLAAHVVRRLPGLEVIGLTGSQGKTSTKDLLAQLLERTAPTVAPAGSLNTEIGTPMTVLRADDQTRYLVLEMGARGRGHIAYLAQLTQPSVGIVLNVGLAHVGEFGSQAEIAVAKGELVEALPADGLAVLNHDDPLVQAMAGRTAASVRWFGRSAEAGIRLGDVALDDAGHPRFTLADGSQTIDVVLPLIGAHHAVNAAAAAAAATGLGMSLDDVAEVLASAVARSRWRMEVSTSAGVTVVNDAYNANPDSMRAALQTLVELGRRRPGARTIAVLGEMLELGARSEEQHRAVGRLVSELGIQQLVTVGAQARQIAVGADAAGRTVCMDDRTAAIEHLRQVLRPDDIVLVKASRGAGLETVALALLEIDGSTARVGDR